MIFTQKGKFTEAHIAKAAEIMARAAYIKCPVEIADFMTQSMAAALIEELTATAKESLTFSLQNYIVDPDEP